MSIETQRKINNSLPPNNCGSRYPLCWDSLWLAKARRLGCDPLPPNSAKRSLRSRIESEGGPSVPPSQGPVAAQTVGLTYRAPSTP